MTSNVGAELIKRQTAMGFGAIAATDPTSDARQDSGRIKTGFKPEFLNRWMT